MALQRVHSMSHESTSFRTKEGTYKKGSFQYCRETRKAHSGKELSPVTVSFVSCKDKEGTKEWITFNSAKEFYFYPFHGMRKVSRDACGLRLPNNAHQVGSVGVSRPSINGHPLHMKWSCLNPYVSSCAVP
jgi:hypothetical protein